MVFVNEKWNDTQAIKGALSVGGRCIAIMPCGLEQIVPQSNKKIAEKIIETGGCIISEYPQGTSIQKYQYVERDKIQSGISQGIIVVEAERESGTMHTAEFALRQNKRIACYYNKLLQFSSGNEYLESMKSVNVINSKDDMHQFVDYIVNDSEYQQINLMDLL